MVIPPVIWYYMVLVIRGLDHPHVCRSDQAPWWYTAQLAANLVGYHHPAWELKCPSPGGSQTLKPRMQTTFLWCINHHFFQRLGFQHISASYGDVWKWDISQNYDCHSEIDDTPPSFGVPYFQTDPNERNPTERVGPCKAASSFNRARRPDWNSTRGASPHSIIKKNHQTARIPCFQTNTFPLFIQSQLFIVNPWWRIMLIPINLSLLNHFTEDFQGT